MANNMGNQVNRDWFMRHRWLLAAVTFCIVGAGIIVQLKINYYRHNLKIELPVHKPIVSPEQRNYLYSLEEIRPGTYPYDERLVRTNADTGVKETVIASIRQAANIPSNHSLRILSITDENVHLIEILPDSDAPPYGMFSYNFLSKTIQKHDLSNYYTEFGIQLSPDGERIAGYEDSALFVIELDTSKLTKVGQLSEGETYNMCINDCIGGFYGQLDWVDENTLEVGVFLPDEIEINEHGLEQRPLKETRQYKIN